MELLACGRSQNSVNPLAQVHGGEVSSRGDVPWMAAVYCRSENTDKWLHTCSGTLLSPNLVLSGKYILKSCKRIPWSSTQKCDKFISNKSIYNVEQLALACYYNIFSIAFMRSLRNVYFNVYLLHFDMNIVI